MTAAVIQRTVVLAAVALLAGVGAVALASRDARAATATQLRAVPTPDGGWYTRPSPAAPRSSSPTTARSS